MSNTAPSQQIDIKKCDDLIAQYLDVGYKNSKAFSIKDGAQIARIARILKGVENDDTVSRETLHSNAFQLLEAMNKAGAYNLADVSNIDIIIDGFRKHYEGLREQEKNEKAQAKEV